VTAIIVKGVMRSVCLSSIEEALEYGYGELSDPDELYLSPQWIKMEEEVRVARPFHLLCLADGEGASARPAAVAAAWGLVVEQSASWPFMRADYVLTQLLETRGIPVTPETGQTLKSLLPHAYLGALRGGTTRLQVSPALSPAGTRQAVREVLQGAEAMARAEGIASIAFLYVPDDDEFVREVLDDLGYLAFGPAHNASLLNVPGQTFTDYLSGFGKRRRDSIRWERRKVAAAGVQIAAEPLSRDLSEEMMPLEAQLFRKYGHPSYPADITRRLHRRVAEEYGRSAQVITARADGALRGYAAFIRVGATLYSRDTGYDYPWQQGVPLYFEVLFYSAIELAQRSGARQINYSYGSDETKASRGCDLVPRLTYLKALDPAAAAGLNLIQARLSAAVPS
jgi:hypothetical protein